LLARRRGLDDLAVANERETAGNDRDAPLVPPGLR
jgi:hypothetical protein